VTLWDGVLDLQLELSDWFQTDKGLRFGAGFFVSAYKNPVDEYEAKNNQWKDEEDARRNGRRWSHRMSSALFNAEPVSVDRDMMTVVKAAVSGFQPEPLQPTDLITPHGLLVLPESMSITDPGGKRLTWRLCLWFPYQRVKAEGTESDSGIHMVLFHDRKDPDDIDMAELETWVRRNGERFTTDFLPTHVVDWSWGETLSAAASHATVMDMSYSGDEGQPIVDTDGAGIEVHSMTKPSSAKTGQEVHQQVQGIWRLLMQHIAVRNSVAPNRQERKRTARLPQHNITFVRLRRPESEREPGEPTTVHWSHRWLVGGHWRNQWYPSLGMHRQIWISPYVKGPEELPLVANKGRVFRLDR
jgi:hypothetical protein